MSNSVLNKDYNKIAEDLYNKIAADYTKAVNNDQKIAELIKKIKSGKGDQNDVTLFSARLGRHAKESFEKYLVPTNLPNEQLYWNVAQETVKPIMENIHSDINTQAIIEQVFEDSKSGVKVNIIKGSNSSIKNYMNKICTASEAGDLKGAIERYTEQATRQMYDSFQQTNADLRAKCGYEEYVYRKYDGKGLHGKNDPCQFCLDRAGTFQYPDEAKAAEVFARHPGCGCMIVCKTKRSHGEKFVNNFSNKTNAEVVYEQLRQKAFMDYVMKSSDKSKAERHRLWREYEDERDRLIDKYKLNIKKTRVEFQD